MERGRTFLTETFNVFIYLDVDGGGGIFFQTQRAVFYKIKNRTTRKQVKLFFVLFLFIRLGPQSFSFFSPRFINDSCQMTLEAADMFTF